MFAVVTIQQKDYSSIFIFIFKLLCIFQIHKMNAEKIRATYR